MEEAEVLCDRLGIFVDGGFQRLGNPKEVTYLFTTMEQTCTFLRSCLLNTLQMFAMNCFLAES